MLLMRGFSLEKPMPFRSILTSIPINKAFCQTDNSGGVVVTELRKLISPGESSTTGEDSTIGVFGVGSKRAVVALAQHVQITTRYQTSNTYRITYDDEWLKSDSWELPYSLVEDGLPASTTSIQLSRLRFKIDRDITESCG
jgi:hypothetical protein